MDSFKLKVVFTFSSIMLTEERQQSLFPKDLNLILTCAKAVRNVRHIENTKYQSATSYNQHKRMTHVHKIDN